MRRVEAKARATNASAFQIITQGIEWEAMWLDHLSQLTDSEVADPTTPWGNVSPWFPSPENKIQLEWYDPDDATCPACVVCGTYCGVLETDA